MPENKSTQQLRELAKKLRDSASELEVAAANKEDRERLDLRDQMIQEKIDEANLQIPDGINKEILCQVAVTNSIDASQGLSLYYKFPTISKISIENGKFFESLSEVLNLILSYGEYFVSFDKNDTRLEKYPKVKAVLNKLGEIFDPHFHATKNYSYSQDRYDRGMAFATTYAISGLDAIEILKKHPEWEIEYCVSGGRTMTPSEHAAKLQEKIDLDNFIRLRLASQQSVDWMKVIEGKSKPPQEIYYETLDNKPCWIAVVPMKNKSCWIGVVPMKDKSCHFDIYGVPQDIRYKLAFGAALIYYHSGIPRRLAVLQHDWRDLS